MHPSYRYPAFLDDGGDDDDANDDPYWLDHRSRLPPLLPLPKRGLRPPGCLQIVRIPRLVLSVRRALLPFLLLRVSHARVRM